MTCTLDRDGHDIVTWQVNGVIPPRAEIKVHLEGQWWDMDVTGDQVSILVAGPDYDWQAIGGPPNEDCVTITHDQLPRVAINGVTRTDGWLKLHTPD